MVRPRLLDLYCGAGGASEGYHRAGFEVIGVDILEQPAYPFRFIQADATTFPLDGLQAIHASPPCQAFTQMSARWRGRSDIADGHADLLTPTRERFAGLSVPWVIENVPGAIDLMEPTVTLHGAMFGLGVNRPRLFESNVLLMAPKQGRHRKPIGVYGRYPDGRSLGRMRNNGNGGGKSKIRVAMGIDWMTWKQIREAIPPAYTHYIGAQLMAVLELAS
jgi:DNA (cytosine-5)-methyltransferase 1